MNSWEAVGLICLGLSVACLFYGFYTVNTINNLYPLPSSLYSPDVETVNNQRMAAYMEHSAIFFFGTVCLFIVGIICIVRGDKKAKEPIQKPKVVAAAGPTSTKSPGLKLSQKQIMLFVLGLVILIIGVFLAIQTRLEPVYTSYYGYLVQTGTQTVYPYVVPGAVAIVAAILCLAAAFLVKEKSSVTAVSP